MILLGQDNNALTWLLIINAVVFVSIIFIKICYFLTYETAMEASQNFNIQILNWFSLPDNLHTLASRPWTLVSYMFSHESLWQLIGTLLWLWGFGYILQDITGNSKLIPVYIYGGFVGGVSFVLVSSFVPQFQNLDGAEPMLGAGASVMAVAIAATAYSPRYRIFPMINGGIPLWVLTLTFIAVDYATIGSSNAGYAIAHFTGGAMGFLFIKQLQRGNDWGEWMIKLMDWTNDLFNPEKKYKKKTVAQQTFYKATRKPFYKTPHVTQQRLDEILDKINEAGYQSLSQEEKEFLKKASREDL